MTTPTNILLIHSDQHRFDCLGVNGHPFLKTPNLDRLAREGMNFTHAFTPIPICSPARNCLLHGQWPTEHGCIMNSDSEAARWPDDNLPSFSQQLARAGYTTGYVGKWHVSNTRDPDSYGFQQFPGHRAYDEWLDAEGCPPAKYANGWFGETVEGRTPEQTHLAWCADRTIDMLTDAASGDKPFFVRWDPPEPHLPNIVPEPYASMYPPASIPPWDNFEDPLTNKPIVQRQARKTWKLDDWTWDQWAPIVGRYLGEISLMDAQIGRVLSALDELGLADDTLVIYTTDHGDMCGSHGMIDKHFVMYDELVRVPLIARWPSRIEPGSECDAFIAHEIDLASTFCDAGGVPTPDTFRGQSLVPLMTGDATDNGRDDIMSMYHGNQFGLYSQRMIRDRRWKYIWNPTAEDELYDLDTDPAELTNRTGDPACRDELARLRLRLVDWMRDTNDPLVNPWIIDQLTEGLSL
jgi:arylsulfatase A-like enzyme